MGGAGRFSVYEALRLASFAISSSSSFLPVVEDFYQVHTYIAGSQHRPEWLEPPPPLEGGTDSNHALKMARGAAYIPSRGVYPGMWNVGCKNSYKKMGEYISLDAK